MSLTAKGQLCPQSLFAIVRAGIAMLLWPQRQGVLAKSGRRYTFPLPPRSVPLMTWENSAAYLTWGQPDLRGLFSRQAEEHGWTYVERLGPVYILVSERHRLTVITESCGWFLTVMIFTVYQQ